MTKKNALKGSFLTWWSRKVDKTTLFPFSDSPLLLCPVSACGKAQLPACCSALPWPRSSPWGCAACFRTQAVGSTGGLVPVCFDPFKPVRLWNPSTKSNCWILGFVRYTQRAEPRRVVYSFPYPHSIISNSVSNIVSIFQASILKICKFTF